MKTFAFTEYTIIINNTIVEILNKYNQKLPHSHESGGILLGQVIGNTIYITRASTPNMFDKSSRNRFDRDKNAAQIIVDYEYINSDRRIIYLGEWHTHPENYPTPSWQDRKMITDQYSSSKLNEPFLILIIQGIIGIFVGIYNGSTLTQCSEIEGGHI